MAPLENPRKRVWSLPGNPAAAELVERPKVVYTGEFDTSLRRRYYRALEKAGLRRVRFHDLRHMFGSAAITKLDPYAVQSYMGHQHYSTTQRYLHHKPRREDAAALQEAFGRASEPVAHVDETRDAA